MLKLIETGPFFEGEPTIRIVNPGSFKGLVKQAADDQIQKYVDSLSPESGKTYVHILAMGASEYYSSNRNGDWFPEENLKKYYKTFETSPAHFFRHHKNKDPNIASGKVIFAIWNERMKRIELIVELWNDRAGDIIEKLERGEFPSTSMATRTPADTCSICGNVARTRQQYCEHLRDQLGHVFPDGRKVYAINDHPLKFFDISYVIKPADVTSGFLQKVASEEEHIIGSAELAELEGLTDYEKSAAHKKFSEFIKELEGQVVGKVATGRDLTAGVQDPHHTTIPDLAKFELGQIFSSMARLGISPSIGYLAELIGHKIAGPEAVGIGVLIEGYLDNHGLKNIPILDRSYDEEGTHQKIIEILTPSIKTASLYPDFIAGRYSYTERGPMVVDKGQAYIPGTGVGYYGNGPHVEPTPREIFDALARDPRANESGGLFSMIKTLLQIGGAAIAAKWYITKLIEEHAKKSETQPIKIVLVKSANDLKSTAYLANISLLKAIRKI